MVSVILKFADSRPYQNFGSFVVVVVVVFALSDVAAVLNLIPKQIQLPRGLAWRLSNGQ